MGESAGGPGLLLSGCEAALTAGIPPSRAAHRAAKDVHRAAADSQLSAPVQQVRSSRRESLCAGAPSSTVSRCCCCCFRVRVSHCDFLLSLRPFPAPPRPPPLTASTQTLKHALMSTIKKKKMQINNIIFKNDHDASFLLIRCKYLILNYFLSYKYFIFIVLFLFNSCNFPSLLHYPIVVIMEISPQWDF